MQSSKDLMHGGASARLLFVSCQPSEGPKIPELQSIGFGLDRRQEKEPGVPKEDKAVDILFSYLVIT